MAQTQNYEKVLILNSSLDNEQYPENSSSEFTNRIFPINTDSPYDAIYPMLISVPIKKKKTPGIPTYRMNSLGKSFFKKPYYKFTESANTVQLLTNNQKYVWIKLTLAMFPCIDISNITFTKKQPLDGLFNFGVIVELVNQSGAAAEPTKDFLVFGDTKPYDPLNDYNLKGYGKLTPQLLSLKIETIGSHDIWRIMSRLRVFNFEDTFDGKGSIKCTVTRQGFPNSITLFYLGRMDFDYLVGTWNSYELKNALEFYNNDAYKYFYQNIFSITDLHVTFPTPDELFEEVQYADPSESDDNQQIYVHCDSINSSRIANQYEPIFQDAFLTDSAEKYGRFNDYISLPMFQPIDLIKQPSTISFQLLNALGENNPLIDDERSTIVICKLIKKYYDFTDAKKKTHITNLFTF